MLLKPLDPVPTAALCDGWDVKAIESGRSANGLKTNLMLSNGDPQHYRMLDVGDAEAQEALATIYAAKTGLDVAAVLHMLLQFIVTVESATRSRDARSSPTPKAFTYTQDPAGLWLLKGSERTQLTNFRASICADIVEDDGTADTKRFFELDAHAGDTTAKVRVAAKEFHTMHWVPETLGAKARVFPGPFFKEHAAGAMQDLSAAIDTRHTFVHTGWRELQGHWHYLHGAGAITAHGAATDILVSLSDTLARYQLPAPPTGDERCKALEASLALRDVAADHAMIPVLANAYLAPLRTLLAGEPPDFTTWIVGASGQYKSEYAALALAHYGDFTRLTLPASFVATGNGLERLCHALQDCLLVVDDYYPAGDRRQAEAMNQTAGRLLRGIGNQTGRQRMRQDTSMRTDLPPRCLALATGERLPDGYSTNARIFLVTVPQLTEAEKQARATRLTAAQDSRKQLPKAMATYLQWIAAHWDTLSTEVPDRFHALRTAAYQAGSHAREPSQVAYLQLGWEMFTRCAVEAGALTAPERETLLHDTQTHLLGIASEHTALLRAETTVSRFLALLADGLRSKHIYLRTPDDKTPSQPTQWGWTERIEYDREAQRNVPVAHPQHATQVGYVEADYLYLLPETLYGYLHEACRKAQRPWPVDNTTLLRELDDAGLIRRGESGGRINRLRNKKINGQSTRCIWLKLEALRQTLDDPTEPDAPAPPPERAEYDDDDIPF
jgi:Domain of unknown function (DUF927)